MTVTRSKRPGALLRRAPRPVAGAVWGLAATVVMSAIMLAATAAGIAPMPRPVPIALVAHILGLTPGPALVGLAAAAHLGYGALAGAALAGLVRRVTVWIGLGYGVALWALMGLVWLPYLGWGWFGAAVTPRIAAATLVLHLAYGLTLGLLLGRNPHPDNGVAQE